MKTKLSSWFIGFIGILSLINHGYGQTLTLTGNNWPASTPTITTAGLDYSGTIETSSNYLTIAGNVPNSALISLLSGQSFKVKAQLAPIT